MDPYLKRVIAQLTAKGLPALGKEALKDLATVLCDELVNEVQHNNKAWDDLTVGPINAAKSLILDKLDKI